MSRGTSYLSCCLLVLTLLAPSRPEPGVQKCLVPEGAGAWNPNPTSEKVEVTWDIGNKFICHTRDVCNGTKPEQNSTVIRTQDIETIFLLDNATRLEPEVTSEQPPEMLVQLLPREMQLGNVLIFTPSQDMGFPFSMMVYAVDEQGFQHCNWSSGRAIMAAETNTSFEVSQEFLSPGVHYFIAHSEFPSFSLCQFGLRVRVTVKSSNCVETHSAICNGWGVCITYPNQPSFFCQCCGNYKGDNCDIFDSCLSNPCQNGGLCYHPSNDSHEVACQCSLGYFGQFCENQTENLCNMVDCFNNATCIGNSSHFSCLCPSGLTGTHCEVDINDCEPSPCIHGQCVDQRNGYLCLCEPGYHGDNCTEMHQECSLNPCKNSGYCQEMKDGTEFAFTCHCQPGWSGRDCSTKVPACVPNTCFHGTCLEGYNNFTCTCDQGYTGSRCEVNINDCNPNPCRFGGHCKDGVNAHTCLCIHSHAGSNCQFTLDLFSPILEDVDIAGGIIHNPQHTRNLYIVAGTLTAAVVVMILILIGCYCRISQAYLSCCGISRLFWYKKYREDLTINVDVTSASDCPLAVDSYWKQIDCETEALHSSSSRNSFQNHTV